MTGKMGEAIGHGHSEVVVLGGGPAGLAAARALAQSGVRVVVLERAPWVGGLSRTWERSGCRVDLGGHRWFTRDRNLQAWFEELMGDELVWVDRRSRIYTEGDFYDYPLSVSNVLGTAGVGRTAAVVLSYLYAAAQQRLLGRSAPSTVEKAYIFQFGRRLYEMFFARYTEKVWGRPASALSADWVAQRTKGLSLWATLLESIPGVAKKTESLAERFCYPALGYQRISERMRDDVLAHGGEVRVESRVTGLSLDSGKRAVVRYTHRRCGDQMIEADHVISTIPLGELVQSISPGAPPEVTEAAKSLTFRAVVTVNLILNLKQMTKDSWIYVQEGSIGFGRLHEPKNWSPLMAPADRTLICAEWFCDEGDSVWCLSDGKLIEKTVEHLVADLGFIRREDLIEGFVLRARNAYPVYHLAYGEKVAQIKAHLAQFETQLSIAGRGGTFRYNNADHSIEMGLLAARRLLGENTNPDAVNMSQKYHEERAVG